MTNKEAIFELTHFARGNAQAISMAIEALEKQEPKKPIPIEDKMWTCPNCSNNLLFKYKKYPTELNSKGLDYCLCCGQKVDWKDVIFASISKDWSE